jgi:hypothetical protein
MVIEVRFLLAPNMPSISQSPWLVTTGLQVDLGRATGRREGLSLKACLKPWNPGFS